VTGDIRVPTHARRGNASGADGGPRPRMHVGGPHLHATHLGGPLTAAVQSNYIDRRSELVRTAALRLDRSSPEGVPGNLFPSQEIYFPGINNPN